MISTPYGEFQLLPRSLLITPFGQVLDLQSIRAELAAEAPSTTAAAEPAVPTTAAAEPAIPTTVATPASTLPTVPTSVATTTGG